MIHLAVRRAVMLFAAALTFATTARAQTPADTADLRAAAAAAAAALGDTAAAPAPTQTRLGQNALNPEISATGDFRAAFLRPGPQAQPFAVREFEFAFQSALDPYSSTKIILSVGEEGAAIEEGYVFYTGLPGHVRLDAGRFRQPIGELNRWHLHALPEGEYPLVTRMYTGGDEGLAGTGVSLYWPMPISGRSGTYELTTQVTTGSSDGLFAGGNRAAVLAQLAGFWQLSRATYVMLSVSGTAGSNPDTNLTTRLGALAARLTWRPPNEGTRKEVTLRGELWALQRRFTGSPAPTRVGGYVGATARLGRRWIAGVRADYVESPDNLVAAHAWEVSPTLTFWQSEFVYLRAQFTHSRDVTGLDSERLSLQAVWAMGPHKHELF